MRRLARGWSDQMEDAEFWQSHAVTPQQSVASITPI
jgi:hypothetical protein